MMMSTSRQVAWSAWLLASLFYAYQYVLRVMPNILLPDLMRQFHIDPAVFGQFSGAYYIGYCLMHLPIGILLDRFGPKRVMSICIAMTTVGLLPILFATHWIYPVLGRALIGMGSSAAILGTFKVIRLMFEEKHFARMLSFSVTIGLLGAIYGGMPVRYLCDLYSYQTVIMGCIIFGLLFAVATYILLPNTKDVHSNSIGEDLRIVFKEPRILWICGLAGLMVGPMEGFADAWGSEFLKQAYGLTSTAANSLTSMIYIGMCFAPLLSRVAEKSGRYLQTIASAGFVMWLIFSLLVVHLLYHAPLVVIGGSFFVVGICCAYQILAIYKATTYVPEQVSGLTTAVVNMIIMSFGYLFHSTIGLVVDMTQGAGLVQAYTWGVSVIPITLFLGTLGFFILAAKD